MIAAQPESGGIESMTVTDMRTGKSATLTPEQFDGIAYEREHSGNGERHLVTGGDPDERYPVPGKDAFDMADFLPAEDLEGIALALINSDLVKFGHLRRRNVIYLWKASGGKSSGKLVLGKCVKAAGLVAHFSEMDWVIHLSADHARDLGLSRWQVEASLMHELLHAGEDLQTCEPAIYPHDAEMFRAEIEQYGLWKSDLRFVAPSFRDLPLFADADEGEG
jgi:hypothetical protein